MRNIQAAEVRNGYRSIAVFSRNQPVPEHEHIKFGSSAGVYAHVALTRALDMHGMGSKRDTLDLIKRLGDVKPDMIHLHNIHGYYINYEELFLFLKSIKVPVLWTLHDCWAFTGHCAHFEHVGCSKFITGCSGCPEKRVYPQSVLWDGSSRNYNKKRDLFCSIENLTIVTPSKWLEGLVRQSFLKEHDCVTIHNGIDTEIFAPDHSGGLKAKYGIPDGRFVMLGVSSVWDERKGLDVLLRLAGRFPDCALVLVGLSEKQLKGLPANVTGIARTENMRELAGLYSLADVFVNPTRIENFPTVNLEAQACGTPVISYEAGGTRETVMPGGAVIPQGDFEALCGAAERYKSGGGGQVDAGLVRERFSTECMCGNYLELVEACLR